MVILSLQWCLCRTHSPRRVTWSAHKLGVVCLMYFDGLLIQCQYDILFRSMLCVSPMSSIGKDLPDPEYCQ